MLTTDSPIYLVALVNTAAWFVFHMFGVWFANRLPVNLFHYSCWPYRTGRWELGGTFYQLLFRVRRWKKHLPDGAAMFKGGFPKKHLQPGQDKGYYVEFMKETCRAEFTHWVVMLTAPLFFLWNEWFIAVFMIPYAVATNVPCIIAQRYNRPRIGRYLDHLSSQQHN